MVVNTPGKILKLKCIACEVLARPIYLCAARSPHLIDVEMNKFGLHLHPEKLRRELQAGIDRIEGYDAILLGYGLCGQATAGLQSRSIPLVIPRAHDCITLFLGSRTRYLEQFNQTPGTYWFAQDYIERHDGSGAALSMGVGSEVSLASVYDEYVEKYGKDNADYLMEVMGTWQKNYQRAVYVDMGVGDGSAVQAQAKAEAARYGWTFERMEGDLILIRHLLEGDWGEDFLIVQPGEQVQMTCDENILCAQSLPRSSSLL